MFVNRVQMPPANRCSRQKRRQQREHQPQTGQSLMALNVADCPPLSAGFSFNVLLLAGFEADVIDVDGANAHAAGEAAECLLG